MKFNWGVLAGVMKNWLYFGEDLGLQICVNEQNHHNSCSMTRLWCR